MKIWYLILAVVLLGPFVIVSCGVVFTMMFMRNSDCAYQLTDEYNFVATSPSHCYIEGPSGTVVPPSVQGMQFVEDMVIGHAIESSAEDSVSGYFILNLESGDTVYGLSEAKWLQQLKSMGIAKTNLILPVHACEQKGLVNLWSCDE